MKVVSFVSLVLLSLIHDVLAIVQFSSPSAGATFATGTPINVAWEYTGLSNPSLGDDVRFDLFLCAGGNGNNDPQEKLATLIEDGALADTNSVPVNIDPSIGGEHANAYFLRMVLVADESTIVIHSNRFTLTDMTGSFSPSVSAALQSISSTEGPPSYMELSKRQAPPGALHTVPYPDQTGAVRYAPMPKPPGSKITVESAKPQFPTSSYRIATTFLPSPTVEKTISVLAAQTVTSMENTIAAAPDPTDDMDKFLNRWKD